ncbi:MAG: polymer-forming cytoskeletal protein [Phycisphaeraceae bacterium]|nr:polymer-forming cytoskeletal protein [Phycisphaeraceae bacterium]
MTEQQDVRVGKGWVITGDLSVEADATFEGQLSGTLRGAGQIDLAPGAVVQGAVIAPIVRVAGQAQGDIVAQQEVELMPGSRMRGRVYSNRFVVNEGAGFRGEIWVDEEAMTAADQQVLQNLPAATPAPGSAAQDTGRHASRSADLSDDELASLRSPVRTRPREIERTLRMPPAHSGNGNGHNTH